MKDPNQNYIDWDDSGEYGTGRTTPPKNRGGLLAVLLILIILLCGIITVLGVMNIRLFQKLQVREKKDLAMSFSAVETQAETTAPTFPEKTILTEKTAGTASIDLAAAPAAEPNIPVGGSLSLQEIYSRSIGSVVSISCILSGGSSTGTGVVLTQDGYIVTNAHVVEKAGVINAQLTDGRILQARLVGLDEPTDLAVLHVDAADLIPAQFGDSTELRVGDTVVAIGDPLGVKFRGTFTNGIISGIDRDVEMNGRVMTLIQTNAALNSGNSGGPLINTFGQVIGINTMKISAFTDKAGVEGLGFAIPSTTVKDVIEQLITQGYVSGRPTLGIQGEGLSSFYQHYYRIPAGVYITSVSKDSDAWTKGIEDGDILLSINNIRVTNSDELKAALYGLEAGQSVQVIIFRGGNQYQADVILSEDKGN